MNDTPRTESDSPRPQGDSPQRKWRGRLAAIAGIPARTWRKLVVERKLGYPGYALFGLLVLVSLYVVATPVVMVLNYRFATPSKSGTLVAAADQQDGLAYVDAILHVHETAMQPWLVNDRIYPTIFLDNPQNFQRGILEGVRYSVRILRDNLSRLRSTDVIDADIEEAFTRLSISDEAWIFPMAEREYAKGMAALRRYRARLVAGEAHFHPRADNLVELLQQLNSLTGGANTRLFNCVDSVQVRLSEETLGDTTQAGEKVVRTEVGWLETDDHFYYARGVAFVYREILTAVNHDFRKTLELRNAQDLSNSIVRDFLEYAQFEPIYVAKGSYGSPWANHPYQLLGLLSQVRERSRSLMTMVSVDVK